MEAPLFFECRDFFGQTIGFGEAVIDFGFNALGVVRVSCGDAGSFGQVATRQSIPVKKITIDSSG